MAITYVGGQTAAAGNVITGVVVPFALTGGLASTPAAGDLVLVTVVVGAGGGSNPPLAITTPAGYTALGQLDQNAASSDTSLNVSYKRMTGTPDASVTVPGCTTFLDARAYTIQVFRGVHATTPLDVTPVGAGATGTMCPNPAAITPVTAGAWVVLGAGGAATTTPLVYTPPAGYATNFLTTTGVDTTGVVIGSGYRTWAGGVEDPAAYTNGTTDLVASWASYTIALRPDAAPPIRGAFVAGEATTVTTSRAAAFGLDGATHTHGVSGTLQVYGAVAVTGTVQVDTATGVTATQLVGRGPGHCLEAVTVGTGLTFTDNVLAAPAATYDAPLSDGDLAAADLIFANGACVIVQVPT